MRVNGLAVRPMPRLTIRAGIHHHSAGISPSRYHRAARPGTLPPLASNRASQRKTRNNVTMVPTEPIGVAVIGAGYWGPNLVRNFSASSAFYLRWLCDLDRTRAERALGRYSTVQVN